MKEHFLNTELRDAFFEFLNEKFKNNEIDFKQLVDSFKSIKDRKNNLCLYKLLENGELFKELIEEPIESNKLNINDLRYLLNRVDKQYELDALNANISLLKHIVDNELFQELIDTLKSTKNINGDSCLFSLLWNKDLFEELIKNNKLNDDDLRCL